MKKMNGKMNLASKRGSALIMIVLMFAMLLVLGTGAGVIAASSSHNSIRETKQEQAYIAARSVALAIKDEITGASDPEALITNLKNNTALSAGFLDGATYDLDISDLDANTTKFTVTAITASAVDTYSFVMSKNEVSNPQALAAVSFMLAHSVTGQLQSPVYGSIYLHDIGSNSNNSVVVKANIYGSFFVNEPKNGNKIIFELGSIHGADDFLNESRKLGLVAGSNVESKIPIIGDVYVKGDLDLQNIGTITGDVYISGSIKNHTGKVNGTVFTDISSSHSKYDSWKEHMDILSFYAQKGNIMNRPAWAEVDSTLLSELNSYQFAPITSSPSTQTINQDYKLDVSKLESGPSKLIIDASSKSNGINILLTKSSGNLSDLIIKNATIETKGVVRFYLPNGANLKFENGGSIVTDSPTPTKLTNYFIGLGQNNITLSSGRGSMYAFVYIQPQGNDTGWGSGSFKIEGEALSGYDKFFGSIYAKDIVINPASNSTIRYGGTDAFDSDNSDFTTTTWNYAGVTAP